MWFDCDKMETYRLRTCQILVTEIGDVSILFEYQNMTDHIPDVLVHITHRDNVASILRDGLLPNMPRTTDGGIVAGRVFLALDADVLTDDTLNAAFFKGPDAVVLEVDVSLFKSTLHPDPEWRSYGRDDPAHRFDDVCWYVEGSIAPMFIRQKADPA